MSRDSSSKYREVVESVLPDEAKKYAPLVLGRVKAHLGSLSRDENCYHTLIAANALLTAWQKWQAERERYSEAQFLELAKWYVRGYLLNEDKNDIAVQKSMKQGREERQRHERETKDEEQREIQEAQERALRGEPSAAPEPPRAVPHFDIFHYRVQLLPTREQAFMQWLHYTGTVAAASKEMNLTRQAGNDIKRSAEKILAEYAARLENGETYSQLRQEAEAKRKPGRYDAFLQRVTAKINRQGTAYQAAPIVDEEGEAYGYDPEDEEDVQDYRYDDWQHDLMVNEACYREDILGQSSYDERYG